MLVARVDAPAIQWITALGGHRAKDLREAAGVVQRAEIECLSGVCHRDTRRGRSKIHLLQARSICLAARCD